MTPKQATRLIATSLIVAVGIIAWRHVKAGTAPPPSAFVYPTAMYGGLALIADLGAPALGGILALALTVGIGFRAVELGAIGAGRSAARPYRDAQGNLIDPATGGVVGGVYGPPTGARPRPRRRAASRARARRG